MKLAVVGTGYVGLVTGACFADMGNEVWCVDSDVAKIEGLKKGVMPIYEPGLDQLVERGHTQGRLHFVTSVAEGLAEADICFIAVGTPASADGSTDLKYVYEVAEEIGRHMQRHTYVVDKSTVPVGTARKVAAIIQGQLNARGSALTFDLISNPEFLKEGTAIADCNRPVRIVIGADREEAVEVIKELCYPFVRSAEKYVVMDIESAEMTKYAANAILATKISFMNEIADVCERVGADVNKVRLGIGSDPRIGYSFIYAGCGYGGSCFPKDLQSLIYEGRQSGAPMRVLQAVEDVNHQQKLWLPARVVEKYGENLKGHTFAIWGLAFKPETDDMRDAPSLTVIRELLRRGAEVQAYDPKAMEHAKNYWLEGEAGVRYYPNKYDALNNADALLLVTEWKEFRSPDFYEISARLKAPVIFDGRNQYGAHGLEKRGIEYHQVGVGAP